MTRTLLFQSSVTSAEARRGNVMTRKILESRKLVLKRLKRVSLQEMRVRKTSFLIFLIFFLNSLNTSMSDDGVLRRCDTTGNLHKQCLNDGDFCYCLVSPINP